MLATGSAGVAPFIAGYVVGDMIWLVVAATGLAALANAFAGLFTALKYAGAAYLLYRRLEDGDRAGRASARRRRPPRAGWRAFFGSLSLTLGNPKVMVFFLSIMPLVVDVRSADAARDSPSSRRSACSSSPATLAAYALAANRARALFRSARAMRFVHRAAGGADGGRRGRDRDEVSDVGPDRDRRGAGRTEPGAATARPSCRASAATRRTR